MPNMIIKKRHGKLKVFALVLLLFVVAGGVIFSTYKQQPKKVSSSPSSVPEKTQKSTAQGFNKTQYSVDTPGSLWWIINKKRPLPKGYVPPDLTTPNVTLNSTKSASENTLRKDTAGALEKLFAAAKGAGFEYMLASGYRSEQLQATYYNNYVTTSGQAAADRYSAKPGTSEHQTGMALDVATADRKHYLDQAFGKDPAGVWLAAHAHEYGFIIRYQEDKEAITGYMYEPWHIRFVGTDLSSELYNKHQTMEEFFGL